MFLAIYINLPCVAAVGNFLVSPAADSVVANLETFPAFDLFCDVFDYSRHVISELMIVF